MQQGIFKLKSDYKPTGDQPEAIRALTEGIAAGERAQTLLGVTGSGKTFTMANVIANLNRPTLVLAHNKTLAAQLCTEFRSFFPENAVEYFVSYYDYYQPEAYIPGKDMYIEKDAMINEEIDMLRHSATSSLFERRDVIIVASVNLDERLVFSGPDIVSRGFVYVKESTDLVSKTKAVADAALNKLLNHGISDSAQLKSTIRDDVAKFIYKETKRRPMILPILMEV